jgi:hypothetical protein
MMRARLVSVLAVLIFAVCLVPLRAGAPLRVAVFRCDVTPDLGEPLIWTTPAARIADPLWAKGIIIENGRERYVLCAMDWCGVGGETCLELKKAIASAARTDVAHVTLHSVHQHTAPYIDGDGYRLMAGAARTPAPLTMSRAFLDKLAARFSAAVREALPRAVAFDSVGTGSGIVREVASARRIAGEGGTIITRFSTSGKDPAMAALPEGNIDPLLRTVTLAAGGKPVVRLHYYATHPQTFCCEGTVSGDFVSAARERVEKEEGVPQVYFTGCSGDITVGKYNDSSAEARSALGERLYEAMKSAIAATTLKQAEDVDWRSEDVRLPLKTVSGQLPSAGSVDDLYRAAITLAFTRRTAPLSISALRIGAVRILHLPGEPMLEFQRYALSSAGGGFFAVAGYADISPGYLCTDRAYTEGGYEPSASNTAPGTEPTLKSSITKLGTDLRNSHFPNWLERK